MTGQGRIEHGTVVAFPVPRLGDQVDARALARFFKRTPALEEAQAVRHARAVARQEETPDVGDSNRRNSVDLSTQFCGAGG